MQKDEIYSAINIELSKTKTWTIDLKKQKS